MRSNNPYDPYHRNQECSERLVILVVKEIETEAGQVFRTAEPQPDAFVLLLRYFDADRARAQSGAVAGARARYRTVRVGGIATSCGTAEVPELRPPVQLVVRFQTMRRPQAERVDRMC